MPATRVDTLSFQPERPGDYELRLVLRIEGMDQPIQNRTVLKVGR